MENISDEIILAAVSSTTAVSPGTTVSSTTLQDLPVEVLDYILMEAVVQEVMDTKLAKSAWIDCASRVIKTLRTVSLQWNDRLTTEWFEIVLHRTLNCIDSTAITVDLITRSHCDVCYCGFGRLNNKIYCIESPDARFESDTIVPDASLHVFEEQDTTHCIKIIPLPLVKDLGGMATCKRSNSIYVWQTSISNLYQSGNSVWRLVPDGNGGFEVLQWPTFPPSSDYLDCEFAVENLSALDDGKNIFRVEWPTFPPSSDSSDCSTQSEFVVENLSVLDDGNLLALRRVFYEDADEDNILSVHTPDGLAIRSVKLSHDAVLSNVAMKSNENFVYAQETPSYRRSIIREVDQDGKEICNFHWLHICNFYSGHKQLFVDAWDRVILHDGFHSLIFLDSELNILEEVDIFAGGIYGHLLHADFDKETSEMIVMYMDSNVLSLKLTL